MKKHIFGRKLKRDIHERKALFKSLMSELVLHGRIKTTEPKAKAIKASAEKLVKKAQKETLLAKKLLSSELVPKAIDKMIASIAPKFVGRNGGYTRIIRVGKRFNDDASMVILEWVESVGLVLKGEKQEETATPKKSKKSEKKEVKVKKEKQKTTTKSAKGGSSSGQKK